MWMWIHWNQPQMVICRSAVLYSAFCVACISQSQRFQFGIYARVPERVMFHSNKFPVENETHFCNCIQC